MASYTVNGLVIHRINTGETDRILTLYTREKGKLSAIAKGSRRAGSRSSGATELFTASKFLLGSGKSLDVVSQVEIRNSYSFLRNDLERLARASYFCELLDAFTIPYDDSNCMALYDLFTSALSLLEEENGYLDGVVHACELRLLEAQGYAPELVRCVMCGEEAGVRSTGYSPSLGGILCAKDRFQSEDSFTLMAETVELLHLLQTSKKSVLLQTNPSQKCASELAKVMRRSIRERIERELKSAMFLDSMRSSS